MDGVDAVLAGGRTQADTAAAKRPYTVACSAALRDAVTAVARRHGVNVADVVRSVLFLVPPAVLAALPDPGEPGPEDRETVVLKSGASAGRPWRRKPRLQVRLAPGADAASIRRAAALALALDRGDLSLRLADGAADEDRDMAGRERSDDEAERLQAIISVLAFDPLTDGVQSREDALHVLGFAPGCDPDRRTLRARFRLLATIHHPDSPHGSHRRMSQLNAAMGILHAF